MKQTLKQLECTKHCCSKYKPAAALLHQTAKKSLKKAHNVNEHHYMDIEF